MRKLVLIGLLGCAVLIAPLPAKAADTPPTKTISWMLRTYSSSTGATVSQPQDKDQKILLLPSINKDYECVVLTAKSYVGSGTGYGADAPDRSHDGLGRKSRSLVCFHKNAQGQYDGFVSNDSVCRVDGTKEGTEIAHLDVAVIPFKNGSPDIILMSLDLFCSVN